MCWDICFYKNWIFEKKQFPLSLKFNLLFFLKCSLFFLFLAYFCSEVIILIIFLVNILRPFFLIYWFNERFEMVQNTVYIKRSFNYVLGYHSFL